jgi:hypothetical protein
VREVLKRTESLAFAGLADDEGRYAWIESVLRRFGYRQLGRANDFVRSRRPERSPPFRRPTATVVY